MEKRWTVKPYNYTAALELQKAIKINPILCNILLNRNITNYTEAKNFFRPELSQLHSPWLMKDMNIAVERILYAIHNHEKILVFGDYDVDGTTSVACMYKFLKNIYQNIDFYIPHRYKEGYGISKLGIDYAKETGCKLIIALDCGIKSVELIDYANTLQIDFIVCDHHLPDKTLPKAYAILNPKQPNCNYPYKELCGCGVGFKLMQALAEKLNLTQNRYLQFLDLVATAIAADIVPITGENRVLAFYGLKKVNDNPNTGIATLMKLAGASKEISINNLVFIIAPRINAAGRMDDAKKAVQLFIEEDEIAAEELAKQLHQDNVQRKEADINTTEEALALIEQDQLLINKKTTVLYQEHWHKGVVGIVASRLIEKYYRPTVVLTKSGDIIAGSARSVADFNLYEAIHACREHLLGYGGHFAAAGMTLTHQQLPHFIEKFEEVVAATINPSLLIPEIIIDAEISFKDITPTFYNIIEQMQPFGPENMKPVFLSKNVSNTGFSKIVKENHLKFSLIQEGVTMNGIGFNMAHKFRLLQSQKTIDLVFTVEKNEFNGNTSLQLKVIDFK